MKILVRGILAAAGISLASLAIADDLTALDRRVLRELGNYGFSYDITRLSNSEKRRILHLSQSNSGAGQDAQWIKVYLNSLDQRRELENRSSGGQSLRQIVDDVRPPSPMPELTDRRIARMDSTIVDGFHDLRIDADPSALSPDQKHRIIHALRNFRNFPVNNDIIRTRILNIINE